MRVKGILGVEAFAAEITVVLVDGGKVFGLEVHLGRVLVLGVLAAHPASAIPLLSAR